MTTTINASTVSGLVNSADTSGILQLQTASTAALTIDASQRVGIGTTSPVVKLNVVGSSNANNAGIAGGSYGIRFENGVTYSLTGSAISGVDNTFTTSFQPLTVNGSQLGFAISGTEAMRIDSSGNVGIGTSSPVTKVDIQSTVGLAYKAKRTSSGVAGGIGAGATSQGLAIFTTDYYANTPIIFGFNQTDTSDNPFLGLSEKMRIDTSGNLLVGTTNATITSGAGIRALYSATIPQIAVTVSTTSNNYLLYNSTAAAYRFFVSDAGQINATSTSITAISDQSLKENIRDLETGLAEVLALKPRRFDWKEETHLPDRNVAGFIAQEVAEILPELVYDYQYDENVTKKSLKMGDMLPTLVKAIQEQQALITAQAETINALTARIVALEGQ